MRSTTLTVICLLVGMSASMAMGQDSFDFSFDGEAWGRGRVDPPDGPVIEDIDSGPVSAYGYAWGGWQPSEEQPAYPLSSHARVSAKTISPGLVIESTLDIYGIDESAEARVTVTGTFQIDAPGSVDFVATADTFSLYEMSWNYSSGPQDTWLLEVWDESDPGTILFQLNDSNLSADMTLAGGTDYGVSFVHYAGVEGMDNIHTVDIEFSATPEPATMGLLAMGGIALLKRRKR
jgi:hypothetical protein